MKSIAESKSLCRLCGHDKLEVINIFDDRELMKDLAFFLPIEVSFWLMWFFNLIAGIYILSYVFLFGSLDQDGKSISPWNLWVMSYRFLITQSIICETKWRPSTYYGHALRNRKHFCEKYQLLSRQKISISRQISLNAKSCLSLCIQTQSSRSIRKHSR